MLKIILFLSIVFLIYKINTIKYEENYSNLSLTPTPPFKIDIVYTWAGENHNKNNERLSDNNELKYSLRSVMKYAPWVNKIYILMNPPKKKPSWFNKNYKKKIILIDHNDTFKNKKYLPSTNSNSIETTLVNIKGLSEHFIYFNDDFYLGNYISYLDFFNRDGSKVIVDEKIVSNYSTMIKDKIYNLNIKLPSYCGIAQHIPFGLKKSIIREFQKKYSDYIHFVRKIKYRTGTGMEDCYKNGLKKWCQQQYGPISKFALDNNYAISYRYPKKQIKYISYLFDKKLYGLTSLYKNRPKFFCINDVKIDNEDIREKYYKKVNSFLNNYYQKKSFFEK